MENDCDENKDDVRLLPDNPEGTGVSGTLSNSNSNSSDTIVFDSNMMKTSTHAGELVSTWGGRRSHQDSARLRRTRSWSGIPPDDVSSEIRILRERLLRTQTRPRPSAVRHLNSRQRLTLISLALVDFMSFCSMSVMAPFFPREAAQKGLSDTMCGMVFSFYAVVMFVTSPIFGKFLPVMGAKFIFTAGMFIAGGCNVLFGTLVLIEDVTVFTWLCFVVRGLEALGASAYSTASYVFVVNSFPDNIGSVLGILETFVGLGMSVGPAIGGLLYSIGGFGLPFYTLGIVMMATVPINYFLLADCEEFVTGAKTGSIMQLFKIPSIIITGLVIVIVSNTWAFLDPTLEPHLRQFGLSTEQIGLIFLLFSALYGIFSPIWGWVADRVHNHWCMMVWGLFLSTVGLLLLGPCPFIPGLPPDLWLDLVALSILGMSVALTLLPTFQGVLTSSIYEGGCPEALATYSAVAGVWSACYSLGEVLGPALGGFLAERYGFPLCATLCAAACFTMAVVTLTFFSLRESTKSIQASDSLSESIPYTDSTWTSNGFVRTRSAPASLRDEASSLLPPSHCSCSPRQGSYGATPSRQLCLLHHKNNRSLSANFADGIAYFLKFQYLTDAFVKLRKPRAKLVSQEADLYQNYFSPDKKKEIKENGEVKVHSKAVDPDDAVEKGNDKYVTFLENAIFGSPEVMENVNQENLMVKRNHTGLIPKLPSAESEGKKLSAEILRHNVEKVIFYEQSPECSNLEDIFDGCGCRDDVTYVRGTVALSSTGACEV